MAQTKPPYQLQDALDSVEQIISKKGNRQFLFFFDFDGTLVPIGPEPDKVRLDDSLRNQIQSLSQSGQVAVVSGRDRHDIEEKVKLDNIYYAGSHGFDIAGPNKASHLHPKADVLLPKIKNIAQWFREALSDHKGVWVEQKKFAVALHHRKAEAATVNDVEAIVKEKIDAEDGLKWDKGKSIIEIKPSVNWHKGKAVLWIMEHLNLNFDRCLPIYLGDDTTDEDAFQAIQGEGFGILVEDNGDPTYADFLLKRQKDVSLFINKLSQVH